MHFADERDRAAFLDDYLQAIRELTDRYGARTGLPYKVVVAAYPSEPAETEEHP